MMEKIQIWLIGSGTEVFIFLLVLFLVALIANFVVKRIFLLVLDRLLEFTTWDEYLEVERFKIIPRLANIIPALVIDIGLSFANNIPDKLLTILQNVTDSFIILTIALALSGVLNLADNLYHREIGEEQPELRGYVRILKVVLSGITTILIIATLLDTSPFVLISGLGAMTAVILLIFQETILALIAGFTITSSNILRVNDWIEMPALGVDGDVIDISLYNVKVQNFDKTIVTIPVRKLTTESFKNYRGMHKSGGRRIKQLLHIDQRSLRFLDESDGLKLKEFSLIRGYLYEILEQFSELKATQNKKSQHRTDMSLISNLSIFRKYMFEYISAHADIKQDLAKLIRNRGSGPQGVKIEIYCFTNTTNWAEYEEIKARIAEHLLAIAPEFGLALYQYPSGNEAIGEEILVS